MSALGLFSRSQLSRVESLYRQEFPFDNTKDDRLVRHHFLQRIQNRLVLHSMSALSVSGAFSFFAFQWLDHRFSISNALRKLSNNDNHSKILLLASMFFIFWGTGRFHYINVNDLIDLRTQYGRQFISVVMKNYPHKVNYELIQQEAADLLRVTQIQNHQPYQQNIQPPLIQHSGFISPNQHYLNQQQQLPYTQGQPQQFPQYAPYPPQQVPLPPPGYAAGYYPQAPGYPQPATIAPSQSPIYQPYPQQAGVPPQNQLVQTVSPQLKSNPSSSAAMQQVDSKKDASGPLKENSQIQQSGVTTEKKEEVKQAPSLLSKNHVAGVRTVQFQPSVQTPPPQIPSPAQVPSPQPNIPQKPVANHPYLQSGNVSQYQNGYYIVAGQNPGNQANPIGLSSSVGFTPYHQVGQPSYTGHYADISERAKQGNF